MSDKIQKDQDIAAVKEHFAGKRSIDDLTEEQIELAVDMQDQLDNEEEEPEDNAPEEKEEVKPTENTETDSDIHQRLADALADKNRTAQLLRDREKKLEDLKTNEDFRNKYLGIEVKPQVDPERDYLDDTHQATLEAEVKALKEKDRLREEERQKEKEDINREKSQLDIFKQIGDLQDSYKHLKTSESFQKIDKKFIDWKSRAIAAGVDEDQYYNDAEYRKQKDAEGYKLNVSEKDLNKTLEIYKVYGKYKSEVDAGYNSSIERAFVTSSDYKEAMRKSLTSHRRADDDALNQLIEENSREVSLLDTGGAPADAEDLGTLLDEQDALYNKSGKLTEVEAKRSLEIDKIINLMTQ